MAGSSGFMKDFYLYVNKNHISQNTRYRSFQKLAKVLLRQFFATLCINFSTINSSERSIKYTIKIRNSFYLLVPYNRFPLMANTDIQKEPIGSLDYKIDNNNNCYIVKWNDNSIFQLISNLLQLVPSIILHVGTRDLEIDECPSKENLTVQTELLIIVMYILFSKGDLKIHGIIIACAIDFYNSILRLNELFT